MLLASHEADFAKSWGRKARDTFATSRSIHGVRLSKDVQAAANWETAKGGGMVTAGIGGSLTGRGADLLVIDDFLKNSDDAMSLTIRDKQWDWWQSVATTRMEPGGKTIIMATRWHKDDLIGRLLNEADRGGTPVRQITFKAIGEDGSALWPARFPIETLQAIKRGKERYWWEAMYQQNPTRHTRATWPEAYFEGIWAERWPESFEVGAVALDPSKGKEKGDYSGLVFVGASGGKYWVDASIERRPPTTMIRDTLKMATAYRADAIGIEENAWQDLLAPVCEQQAEEMGLLPPAIHTILNTTNKEVRINRLDPHLRAGQFRFRDTPGCRRLVDQLEEFPLAEHDDGPDALEMAVRLLRHLGGQPAEFEAEALYCG